MTSIWFNGDNICKQRWPYKLPASSQISGQCLATETNKLGILWLKWKVTALLLWFPLVKILKLSGFNYHNKTWVGMTRVSGKHLHSSNEILDLLQPNKGVFIKQWRHQVTGITCMGLVATGDWNCLLSVVEGRGCIMPHDFCGRDCFDFRKRSQDTIL